VVVVNPYSVTYDGNPHSASVASITGVNGETGATVGTVDVSNTTHTNAGTYATDYWFFTGGANYNNIGNTTITDQIDKANATVVVTAYSVTFDANPHTATYTVTGVGADTAAAGSSINVSGTTHTGAGTYNGDPWSFNGGANYNDQNGTVDDFIGKANATVVVTAYSVTFDANPHTATYTVTGVGTDTAAAGSSINVSGTTHTGAGTYNGDPWSFTGGANYNDQNGMVDDFIGKANATVVVTAYSVTFDANPHTATYTVTGVGTDTTAAGSSINVSGTTHTGAGTYNGDPWSFTGGANYNDQNGTVDDFIGKANATVVVTAYSVTYDGMSHTATVVSITGVNGETGATVGTVDVSNTTHTNAGTYAADYWFFTGTANYNNIGNTTITDQIDQAIATVTADNKSKTYGQVNPVLTAVVVGEVAGGDAINYTLATSATQFSNVGPYAITVSFGSNPNYSVTATNGTLTINQAIATVTADNKSKTYGDANPTLTATVVGEVAGGDAINYTLATSATQFSNVGPYAITVSFGSNPNYSVTATNGTLTINQAIATVTADNKSKTYGQVNPVLTAVVVGQVTGGDLINYTLSSSATQCSNVGPYAIVVNLGSNPNYNVTPTNGTLTITKAHLTVGADNKSKVYNGLPFTAFTVTITGFTCGDTVAVVSGSATYTGTAVGAILPGTYTITPQQGTLSATNYDFTTFNNGTLTIGYGTCTGGTPGHVILPPINPDGSSVWKVGSTVPVKFTVCDANGNPISDPTAVFASGYGSITLINTVRGTVDNVNENPYSDIPDVAFRWSGGQWIFNMATSNLTKNTTYTFRINLKDGSYIQFSAGTK
jgi:hypothetical protein